MFAWVKFPVALASDRKRAIRSGLSRAVRTLIATGRLTVGSNALYTRPNPPLPSSASSLYLPIMDTPGIRAVAGELYRYARRRGIGKDEVAVTRAPKGASALFP